MFAFAAFAVYWSEFLATDPDVPGPNLGATRFYWVSAGLERRPLSLVRINEELFQW
jgi:hypothetical protein